MKEPLVFIIEHDYCVLRYVASSFPNLITVIEAKEGKCDMNIIVLNYEFPPIGGGAAPVSQDLAVQLSERGHNVTVVTMGYAQLPAVEVIKGVQVYRLKCWRRHKGSCKPWEQLTYLLAVRKFMRKHMRDHEYDICHAHFVIPTGEVAKWIKEKYGIPYIITAHGSDVEGHQRKRSMVIMHQALRKSWRRIVQQAEKVVAPSAYLMDLMNKNFSISRYVYIPNGVDYKRFHAISQWEDKEKIILVMGRLQRFKNVQTIIEALSMIELGEWEVEILGEGPYYETLNGMVASAGLERKVKFRGWVDHGSEEQLNYLRRASVYISSSQFENCPMSVIESIAAGCRPLLSDIPAHRQLVSEDEYYFESDNAQQLAEKLEEYIQGKDYVRQIDVEKYDWENIIIQYEVLLQKIL